jgi:hypothetical protein
VTGRQTSNLIRGTTTNNGLYQHPCTFIVALL